LLVDKVEGGPPGEQRKTDEDKHTPQRGMLLVDKVEGGYGNHFYSTYQFAILFFAFVSDIHK